MPTAPAQTSPRAPLRARLWTWVVSIVLTLSAFGCAIGGGMATCHALGGAYKRGQEVPPFPILGSTILFDAQPMMLVFCVGWLVALALHAYASRRRRMSLVHILVPAAVFLLGLLMAFRGADVCTSL